MSLLSENVIPGNHGKIFGTNADDSTSLLKIQNAIMQIEGVKDVILNEEVFPREFTIHTSKLVSIETVEYEVKKLGFHVIPKGLFKL